MEFFNLNIDGNKIQIINANSFFLRLRGLLGRELNGNNGLLLSPCNQVHTYFMKYAIDVIYLSKKNKVLYIGENMMPYKVGNIIKGAKAVLELKAGVTKKLNINIGDVLIFEINKNIGLI